MEELIRTNGVRKCFPLGGGEQFYALNGVDIVIPRKSLTILKGRSGSGKTTLLNVISGLDYATEGKVYFQGEDLNQMKEAKRERIRRYEMGYVFQSVALIPIMNALENVEFGLRLAKYKGDRMKRARECLMQVGLGKRMLHMPGELSGGEQQRVVIARAMCHKPKIIFADEPTGSLDSTMALQVMNLFKSLIEKEGITIVMTTHDPKLMKVGDVVYEISDGKMIGESRGSEKYEEEKESFEGAGNGTGSVV